MKVWIDNISNDEMISDSYPHKIIFEDACLEVKARYVTKGADNIQIAPDEEAADEADGPTVVDVVDGMRLLEAGFPKKADFMAVVKQFMAKMVEHLKEKNPDRIPGFKKGATEMMKVVN